jgi:hypothetical protein
VLYCPFRKTGQGVLAIGEVNYSIRKPEGNRLPAIFNEGQGVLAWSQWCGYPKPVDLCLSRMKPLEGGVEVRTSTDVQIVWMTWV